MAEMAATRIVITVCTRNRLDLLEPCLRSLLDQLVPEGFDVSIVVCENDDPPKSDALCAEMGPRVTYVQEPDPGISPARNTAVRTALEANADWIVFFDDDQVAEEGWMTALCGEIAEDRADVITGPALRRYEAEPPEWYPPFSGNRKPTGTRIKLAASNNTACRRYLFAEDGLALRFDYALRFAGSSDTELFWRANQAGARFIWCDEQVATEFWPASRLTLKSQLQRAQRTAENRHYILGKRHGRPTAAFLTGFKALRRLLAVPFGGIAGLVLLPIDRVGGKRRLYSAGRKLYQSWGAVRGLLGLSIEAYRGR
ncbi:glycosyltransferase family 2 protein [Pontivivens ytuae]|uniref:Glycosyltransferase family 2 protein n=1 Tax=Pontivivens ytuae TaxID=2789856 RepID=A0A7S9QDG3_9RHOB|nr:glycosyltransferase family 2 protein [Pontivivens ytuae]QPH54968.1 glycosyltransferase family 2 protein [Pontivivens ytuae]